MTTTIEQPDVIDKAFAVDLEAIEAAEAVAASIAAGETPTNIREVCRAAEWDEARLKEEVERMRQVFSAKKIISAEEQVLPQIPKVEAAITAENLRYGELLKEHRARLQPLLQKQQDLNRVHSNATRPRQLLRDELLPRHVHEQIKAINEQLTPLNAKRQRFVDEIRQLKLKIPEDLALMAGMTAAGAREKYQKDVTTRNENRAEIRRKDEAQLEKVKQEMQVLLDRQGQLRCTYASADPWSPAAPR